MSTKYSTPKQIYDAVVKGLREQGDFGADEDGMCVYCSPKGLKCAAGQIIPPELYDQSFENTNFDALPMSLMLQLFDDSEGYPVKRLVNFTRQLQLVHDESVAQRESLNWCIDQMGYVLEQWSR